MGRHPFRAGPLDARPGHDDDAETARNPGADGVDPALGATDADATVSGRQDDLHIALVVTTALPSAVLRQRLGLLAGTGWQLRDVTAA